MKAMILNAYGEYAKFVAADIDKPTPGSGEVLIRVEATSVNTIDTMIRNLGKENLPLSPDLPALLGMDFAGTVEAVGDGVSEFAIGDEVFGCAGGLADLPGALAEYIAADARLIAHKPSTLSMRESAALPLVGITAFEGLQRAGVRSGQRVLVHGGAGGVGHIAVQLAKHWESHVYSTGTGKAQIDAIQSLGATPIDFKVERITDYVQQHTDGQGFDVVFDTVGGMNLQNSFEAAALNAQVATTVSLLETDLTPVHFKGLSLHVVFMLIPMLHDHQRETHGEILTKLSEIVDAGALKPVLDSQTFGLTDVDAAYSRLASGEAIGKIVIDIA